MFIEALARRKPVPGGGPLQQAIECLVRIMEEASEAINFVARAGMYCKGHLLSDLLVVCELLSSAINGAHGIAQANLSLMEASLEKSEYLDRLEQLCSESRALYKSVESALMHRTGVGQVNSPWKY